MKFRWYSALSVFAAATYLYLVQSVDEAAQFEGNWPIFERIYSSLSAQASSEDWIVFNSQRHVNTRRWLDAFEKRLTYPLFLDDCQISQLHKIYMELLGFLDNGTFVEIGASDGRRWSNTYPLAQIGWTGHYVEPVLQYAEICAANHAEHPNIYTHVLAIGATLGRATVHVGAALSTCSKQMLQVYSKLDWSAGYHSGESVEAPMKTLDYFLAALRIPIGFEILIIDVEGFESEVLQGFSALYWRPRIVIVEIEDTHESFRDVIFLQERYRRIRAYFKERHYVEHWRDHINTIYYLPT